jgi:hypothetical protein
MRKHPKTIALTALALGCITLIVPLFTPPDPFYPTLLCFLPYALLVGSLFVARSHIERWGVAVVSVLTLVSAYFYLDSIFFNRVFSWQIVGGVQDVLPVVQLAIAIPTLIVLALRRWRLRDEIHVA